MADHDKQYLKAHTNVVFISVEQTKSPLLLALSICLRIDEYRRIIWGRFPSDIALLQTSV